MRPWLFEQIQRDRDAKGKTTQMNGVQGSQEAVLVEVSLVDVILPTVDARFHA